jgi:pimeloyl-ACP methyl ester carboxylesterase
VIFYILQGELTQKKLQEKGIIMQRQKINDIEFIAGQWPLDHDRKTIIFIHGAGGTNLLWQNQVKELADTANTIAPDLPGHGGSGGTAMENISDYAASMAEFIKSTGVKRPVICGLSMGGAIVLQLMADRQEDFSAGIAANTGAKLKTQPLIFEMIEKDYKGFVNGMYNIGISKKTDPEKIRPLVEEMVKCPPEVTKGDFTACDNFNIMDRLDQIKIPVLVLTASDDQMTPPKFGQYIAQNINSSKIVNIENAGHLSPLEKPAEVSQAIRNFLEK